MNKYEIKSLSQQGLIEFLKKYFSIKELVCPHTFKKFGEKAWQFYDRLQLENILSLRTEIIGVPMVCNNWDQRGDYTQRGLRCNLCEMAREATIQGNLYMSSHANGAGNDFTAKGLSAETCRELIRKHIEDLPNPCRIERDVTWLHIDCYNPGTETKLIEFDG